MTAGVAAGAQQTAPISWRKIVFGPGIVLGIVLSVVGAIVCGEIVSRVWDGNQDGALVAAYSGWAFFFMVGVGAFNGIWEWGWGRQEPTVDQEMGWAGKDQVEHDAAIIMIDPGGRERLYFNTAGGKGRQTVLSQEAAYAAGMRQTLQ